MGANDKGNLQDHFKAASLRCEVNATFTKTGLQLEDRVEAGRFGHVEFEVPVEIQVEMSLGI